LHIKTARLIRIAKLILVNSVVILILLFLIEGFSSYLLVGHQILGSKPIAERAHTEYDEELGWVNLPNVFVENMYGPGVYLQTNSQRYRNAIDFNIGVPNGKVRIVCSGDSFTLGYGVDNEHTWCQQLAEMDERLETVNLGQGGYGIDQAYLWYVRNEKKLEHDIQIFAFITDDFVRMKSDTFSGYGKPYLRVQEDALIQENKPVPKRSFQSPWLTTILPKLRGLNSVRLLRIVSRKYSSNEEPPLVTNHSTSTQDVVAKILTELQQTNQEKQSALVLVYLPTRRDYMGNAKTRHWREYIKIEAAKNNYLFIDIVKELLSELHVYNVSNKPIPFNGVVIVDCRE